MANSQSCVLLHPKTNNPLQNKISSIANKLKKHEKDMKKSSSSKDFEKLLPIGSTKDTLNNALQTYNAKVP